MQIPERKLLLQWKLIGLIATDRAMSRGDIACAYWLMERFRRDLGRARIGFGGLAERTNLARRNAIISVGKSVTGAKVRVNYMDGSAHECGYFVLKLID